jgi:hypothetical protein
MSADTDKMESRLTRALERTPEIAIPGDFALRIAAKMPARRIVDLREVAIPPSNVGFRVAAVTAGLLLVAMFVLARVGGESGALGWVEIGLGMEFAGLTAWLGLRVGMG